MTVYNRSGLNLNPFLRPGLAVASGTAGLVPPPRTPHPADARVAAGW